jgi:nucleotidyltransferase substrate binding protein (TIGR01987 family)
MGELMAIDFSALTAALARLEEGQLRYLGDISDQQIRDGMIQRFEFTYDLSHKMLKRHLRESAATAETIDQMPFPALIRTASEQGLLLGEWAQWKLYRDMRNITSHTYDEAKAREVVAIIPDFIAEARMLLGRLVARTA